MQSSAPRSVPVDGARRTHAAGLAAGAPLTRIHGPVEALALVADDLESAEAALRTLVHSDVAEVPRIAGYLLDAGGKRLRPALTGLGARAAGVEGPVHRLMCVSELIHLGSLLHDDVVDEAVDRRGKPAAYRVYGASSTVLTGDFCLARAVLLAAEEGGHDAVTALAAAVTEMAEGEVLQLKRIGDLDCGLEAYLDVIDRKTAALIGWAASAGALSRGDRGAAAALRRYGRAVGRAFQVTDDVLDYAPHTGKDRGADLRERKLTLPLLYAMRTDPGIRRALATAPAPEAIPELMDRVRATGGLDQALDDARGWLDDGLLALEHLPDTVWRDALASLGRYLVERSS